jgi:hypothetical protein
MESRPYISKSAAELEEIYKNNPDKPAILIGLYKELQHRETPKAIRLRNEIAFTIKKYITKRYYAQYKGSANQRHRYCFRESTESER